MQTKKIITEIQTGITVIKCGNVVTVAFNQATMDSTTDIVLPYKAMFSTYNTVKYFDGTADVHGIAVASTSGIVRLLDIHSIRVNATYVVGSITYIASD